MFLTTNRIGSIDQAFKSRIHLSLAYAKLPHDARRQIWENNIRRGSPAEQPPRWLNAKYLNRVARHQINGRQIKNTVRMAYAIAANEERSIEAEDVMIGLEALEKFQVDFVRAKDHSSQSRGVAMNVSQLNVSVGPMWVICIPVMLGVVALVLQACKWDGHLWAWLALKGPI